MPVEKCKGCLKDDTELQLSHFIPASISRLLDSPDAPNRNPILITSRSIVQTSREIRDYLLCSPCEQLLNRKGEQWVVPLLATRTKAFPLHDILTDIAPDFVEPDVKAYAGSKNPRLRVKDLTHFALGIFWKAAVHSWRSGPSSIIPRIELGCHRENIRSFLFCDGPFPERVALGVNVMPTPVTTMLSYEPRAGRMSDAVHRFSFYVPGILFTLSVGEGAAGEAKDICFYGNPLHPILIKDLSEEVERYPKETYFKGKATMALSGKGRRIV